MSDLQNIKQPYNTSSGLGEKVFIALKDFFIDGGVKNSTPVNIEIPHQFVKGLYGFIECQLLPQKNHLQVKTIADLASNRLEFDLEVVLPGAYAQLLFFSKQLLNKPLIVLATDFCNSDIVYQIGTATSPAYLESSFKTGTEKDGFKGSIFNIKTTGCSVQIYKPSIKIWEEPYVNHSMPVFFSATKMANNNLQDMIDNYCNSYTTTISKIISLLAAKLNNYVIQFEYRDTAGIYVSKVVNSLTQYNLQAVIDFIIDALDNSMGGVYAGNFTATLSGSKLLALNTDTDDDNCYCGFSLYEAAGILTESGDFILTEDDKIIITENAQ